MRDFQGEADAAALPAEPPLPHVLSIQTVQQGIYQGFNVIVALSAKCIVLALVAFLILAPEFSSLSIDWLTDLTLHWFAKWYNGLLSALLAFMAIIICLPVSGRVRLGPEGSRPEHGRTAWLAMVFCAGIGGGILAFSVSEPVSHFTNNPDIISGDVAAISRDAVISSLKYTYLHWGFSAWACYALVGLVLGLTCHRHGQPLTMRSSLAPLFGKRMEGAAGNLIDTISILAIVSGITTTITLGLEQICSGISEVTGSAYFASKAGDPTITGLLSVLVIAISVAIASLLTGVNRGVKWVSDIGILLAFGILIVFVISGSSSRTVGLLYEGTIEYLKLLPGQAILYDATLSPRSQMQRDWQNEWTLFYWAWWIAFAPFVGLFLTKISRGRTVREFLIGAVLAPTTMCFVWFAGIGGSALLLELDGIAGGSVLSAGHAFRIYEAMDHMLTPGMALALKSALVLLFLLLVVASTTAAIMAIKFIGCAGSDRSKAPVHTILWACVIAAFAAAVLAIGGVEAVRDMMIISALPFSGIMALMIISTVRMLFYAREGRRFRPAAQAQTIRVRP
mgnify:CR=1 FL=1